MCGNQQSDFSDKLNSIEEAIEDIKNGKVIIVVDDEDRENEGDFLAAAEKVTPEMINFFAKEGRGLICVPMTEERCAELELDLMVGKNTSPNETAFTVSVEAKRKVSTGISAADRAQTIRAVIDPATRSSDLVTPGHMFPLRAREGGVLVRAGHTEAVVDLAKLAGLYPAGVICEILNEDGSMARLPQLETLAKKWSIKMITVANLIAYRLHTEKLVRRVAEARLPTRHGEFKAIAYKSDVDTEEHLALVLGNPDGDEPILVRVHSQCTTMLT